MTVRAAGVAACAALGWIVSAGAWSALPAYNPGDTFLYSDGRVEQFQSASGDELTWATKGGRTYVRHRNFVLPVLAWKSPESSGTRRVVGKAPSLWPLRSNASARYRLLTNTELLVTPRQRATKRRLTEFWSCRVGAIAALQVHAGTFDAQEIACDRISSNTMRVTRREVWHFAPAVGHYIRKESINVANGKRSRYELVATLTGRDSNPARINAVLEEYARAKP
jgi:hypothetical protein